MKQPWRIVGLVAVAVLVVAGKTYYRDATAADLSWILAPTATLVGLCTGGHFVYEAGPGWVDSQIQFAIAPPCAGIHFALATFLALTVLVSARMVSARATALCLGGAAAAAYLATLVVNTLRITIAIAMHRGTIGTAGLGRAEAHQLEGTLVYLVGLVAIYAIARHLLSRSPSHA